MMKEMKKKKMEKNCYHIYIHYNEGKTKKKNQKEEKPKKRNIIKKNLKTILVFSLFRLFIKLFQLISGLYNNEVCKG